jgi:exonuclease VII small subunit
LNYQSPYESAEKNIQVYEGGMELIYKTVQKLFKIMKIIDILIKKDIINN